MYEVTAEYEAVQDSLEEDIGQAHTALGKGDWSTLIAEARALIAGAETLAAWDHEREQE